MVKSKQTSFLEVATKPVTETLEVAGFKVEVRGLSIEKLETLRKNKDGKSRDPLDVTIDLIVECCFDASSGQPLISPDQKESIKKLNPQIWRTLNDAIARVNGFVSGNSKATDTEDSSSE